MGLPAELEGTGIVLRLGALWWGHLPAITLRGRLAAALPRAPCVAASGRGRHGQPCGRGLHQAGKAACQIHQIKVQDENDSRTPSYL